MGALALLERQLLRLHRRTLAAPRLTLLLVAAVVGLSVFGLPRLTQVVSMQDQLDPQLPSTVELRDMQRDFTGDPSLLITVEAQQGSFTASELCQLRRTIRRLESDVPGVASVASPFDLRRAVSTPLVLHYPALIADPCLGDPARVIDLAALKASPWGGLFLGSEARDLTFTVTLEPGPASGKFGTFRPELVATVIDAVTAELPGRVHVTGTAAQEYYTMQGLAESQWLNLLVLLLIAVSFRLFFGTWKSSAIYALTLFPSSLIVYGLMGWLGHPIDPLSVCLFLMLAISSIEDFVFVSQEFATRSPPSLRVFEALLLPCFMTSLTTIAAFATLGLSELGSIQRFGLWAAVGGAIEWVMTFICLPALLQLFPRLGSWAKPRTGGGRARLQRLLRRSPPRWLTRLALLAFVFAVISVRNFNLAQTPTDVFPKDHPLQVSIDRLLADRGWVASVGLVFHETASAELKQTVRALVARDGLVHSAQSWSAVVDYVAGDTPSELARAMVARELSITEVSQRYRSAGGRERDVLYLRSSNTAEINRLRDLVRASCPAGTCWLSGEFVAFADFSQQLITTLFESLFGSLLIVGLIVAYAGWERGHGRLVPALLLSSFFGPAVMLTVIYAFGLSVNFVTCVVASALIGLTGDNALMFLLTSQTNLRESVEERGVSSVHTAIVMALCSLTFAFSYFEPPRMLGVLLASGFLFSVLGDVWLLKGFLHTRSHD